MGAIRCEEHGLTGWAWVCRHLSASISEKKGRERFVTATFRVDGGPAGEIRFELNYCLFCAADLGLPLGNSDISNATFRRVEPEFDGLCNLCYTGWLSAEEESDQPDIADRQPKL